jgi:hypothetical protein
MAEKLRLFVSATNDLETARAVIGRVVAELPVQIGVEIRRTPVQGAAYDDIFELIANVDRVYFLLGRDITAPAGVPWTPAAEKFHRNYPGEWTRFRSYTGLSRLVTLDLVRILNHTTNRYGLSITDFELLKMHANRVMKQSRSMHTPSGQEEPGGAEGGGVLLDTVHGDEFDDQIDDELLVRN